MTLALSDEDAVQPAENGDLSPPTTGRTNQGESSKERIKGATSDESVEPPWWLFGVFVLLASVLILAFATQDVRLLLVEMFLGMAALGGGILIGFLFGIPRTRLIDGHNDNGSTDNADKFSYERYQPGTSLEQIADWLTKIIIGISLVEVRTIAGALDALGTRVAKSTSTSVAGADVITQLLFVVFATSGFLTSYLWTRIHYGKIQAFADQLVWTGLRQFFVDTQNKLARQESKTESLERKTNIIERVASANAEGRAPKTSTKPVPAEDSDLVQNVVGAQELIPGSAPSTAAIDGSVDVQSRLKTFRKAGVDWDSDPIAEIFSGFGPEANGRRFEAEIAGQFGNQLLIDLTVRRIGGAPLKDKVLFLLHPTYDRRIITVQPKGQLAQTEIAAEGWFTAGAIADNGQTVLTLDLRTIPGAPPWFRKG
jgi:hypothetical protein